MKADSKSGSAVQADDTSDQSTWKAIAPYRHGAMIGIFLLALIYTFKYAQTILVPVIAALLLGLLLGHFQARLERLRLRPSAAATIILLLLLLFLIVSARVLVLPFEEWSARLPEIYSALKRQLFSVRELLLTIEHATDAVQESAGIDASGAATSDMMSAPGFLSGLAVSVPATIGQLVLFFGTLFFLLSSRTRLQIQLAAASGTARGFAILRNVLEKAEVSVSTYLTLVSLINLGLGVVVGIALAIVGLPNPWFWGALAGLFNFIPYVGPLLLTLLLLGAGLLQDGTTLETVLPAMVFFGLNFLEANFVTPAILGQRLLIEPLFVFLSLGFWLWLWGPVGALMAVPLLLVIQAVLSSLLEAQD